MTATQDELRAAFLAGANSTSEGWNGEHPMTPEFQQSMEQRFYDWFALERAKLSSAYDPAVGPGQPSIPLEQGVVTDQEGNDIETLLHMSEVDTPVKRLEP